MNFLTPTILLLSMSGFFISCASVQQELDPKVYYENTLEMEINGQKYYGVGVVKKQKEYKIRIRHPQRKSLDYVRFSSCHREQASNSEGSDWSFGFSPTENLEDSGSCLFHFESYNKSGKHGWGIIDVATEKESLFATVRCNGKVISDTTTICQSRNGLVQEIEFNSDVVLSTKVLDRCKIGAPIETFRKLQFKMPNRECVFAFISSDFKIHKLTTIGYESILIPEN
jgi:hypothetical protein